MQNVYKDQLKQLLWGNVLTANEGLGRSFNKEAVIGMMEEQQVFAATTSDKPHLSPY